MAFLLECIVGITTIQHPEISAIMLLYHIINSELAYCCV